MKGSFRLALHIGLFLIFLVCSGCSSGSGGGSAGGDYTLSLEVVDAVTGAEIDRIGFDDTVMLKVKVTAPRWSAGIRPEDYHKV